MPSSDKIPMPCPAGRDGGIIAMAALMAESLVAIAAGYQRTQLAVGDIALEHPEPGRSRDGRR